MRTTSIWPAGFALLVLGCGGAEVTSGPSAAMKDVIESEAPVTTVACGATVVEDVRLESDLSCTGDAIIVGADNVKINLNGHSITGTGTGIGITVRNMHDVSIFGGRVQGFLTGIMVATSTGVEIKDNEFTQNREGVFLAGVSGSVVKANVAWQNTLRGIMIRPTGAGVLSTDNDVKDNILTNNPSGILVFGQPGNSIKSNTISGSTVAAIDLTGGGAADNVFKDNLLTSSAAGIKFGAGWSGNSFIGNTIQQNTCGTQGPGAANSFKENTFAANTTDICP